MCIELMKQREKLMEAVEGIIEERFSEVFPQTEDYIELRDELISDLCDAVCVNFPTN